VAMHPCAIYDWKNSSAKFRSIICQLLFYFYPQLSILILSSNTGQWKVIKSRALSAKLAI